MAKAVRNGRLRVVIFQEGEWLCAHCLEYDFATQAKSLSDLQSRLERLIAGHIAIRLKHGLKPFRNVPPAPAKYRELFRRSKIPLSIQTFGLRIKKRGIKIPTPEIRVAPFVA